MKHFYLLMIISLIIISSCDTGDNIPKHNSKSSEKTNDSGNSLVEEKISDVIPELPYELKDDGVYVYADGPELKEKIDKYCYETKRDNFRYIKVNSSRDAIINEMGPKTFQNCKVEKVCEEDLGKPSLHELGYERHQEREIKPEDNRFGKKKKITKQWSEFERNLLSEVKYDYISSTEFTQITTSEFQNNGIVIIGKHISRVIVKTVEHLPKYGDKILVKYEKTTFDCDGNSTGTYILEPQVVANFKRVNFKENIFEFIKENPLPKDADYLSDGEFIRLCENIHQFIPRENDRTIHTNHTYRPGYYLIEYYNGNQLLDFHCIKLGSPGKSPQLWDALKFNEPVEVKVTYSEERYVLVVAECNTINQADQVVRQKDPYPYAILPYKNKNGKILVGRIFYNKASAEIEMQRLLNMGVKRETMKLLPFN